MTLLNKISLCNKNLPDPLSPCLAGSLVSKDATGSPLIGAINLETTFPAAAHMRLAFFSLPSTLPCSWFLAPLLGSSTAITPLQTWAWPLSQPTSSPVKHLVPAKDVSKGFLHCPQGLQKSWRAAQQMVLNSKLWKKMFWLCAFSFAEEVSLLCFPYRKDGFKWEEKNAIMDLLSTLKELPMLLKPHTVSMFNASCDPTTLDTCIHHKLWMCPEEVHFLMTST